MLARADTGVGLRCHRSTRLFETAWSELEARGLAYFKTGGSIRLTESGCLGACEHGPTLACYSTSAEDLVESWYDHVDLPLLLEIAERAHRGEALPEDRRFGGR